MKFIDLFAGLGGFHVALSRLGHECVFASEIRSDLAELYERNYGLQNVHSDIKQVHEDNIPSHDIMCAGFPCQPFSKAGKQLGIADTRGNFIIDFERILRRHQPKYFILENVPNLRKHDREESWRTLKETLESCGYEVADAILSPHEFGIPQLRNRIYIVGALDGLKNFKFPEKAQKADLHINQILDKNPENAKRISNEQFSCLNIWQHILQEIPASEKLPSFPLWSMEWGATYPFEKLAPSKMSLSQIQEYRGSFGKSLKDAKNMEEALKMLPSYAQVSDDFPTWKIDYIKSNRDFFKKHKSIIRPYLKQLRKFPVSWQKLEWNCQNEERDLFKYILQFRASGIRVKRSNYSPALVVNTTQLPIIGWEQRYLTRDEAARLQDIYGIELPANDAAAFKALGNAINVHIIQQIAQNLIGKKRGPKKRIDRKECVTEDLKCQAAL